MKNNSYFKYSVSLGVLLILLLSQAVPTFAASKSAGRFSPNLPGWKIVNSPNAGTFENVLNAAAAVSTNDIWAVGFYRYIVNYSDETLIEHWNGSSWAIVASPNPGPSLDHLNAVAAISANDVWAVGNYTDFNYNDQTIIEHWNGSSWNIVASPNPGPSYNHLNGITVLSASDIWAVGEYYNSAGEQTLIEHWDGSKWNIVPSPNGSPASNRLTSVVALSTNNVWAVGYYQTFSGYYYALIEQWNGKQWSIIPLSHVAAFDNELFGVTAVSANNIWAAGVYLNSQTKSDQTVIEHWNGKQWSVVPSPNPGPGDNLLFGICASSGNDVWAVGTFSNPNGYYHYDTLIEQWNGTSWNVSSSPNRGKDRSNRLNGVIAISATDVWTVGSHDLFRFTLTEHYT